jgi:polyisoprenoid-binding protein YceI
MTGGGRRRPRLASCRFFALPQGGFLMTRKIAALTLLLVGIAGPARSADQYEIDGAHAGVNFQASHLGLSWIHGRFNSFSGTFTVDADPAKSSFELTIKTESLDTNQAKRDEHLRSPDFFNVKQFPLITFKSTAVKAAANGLQVTGDLTMHGVTKPVMFLLVGGRTAEFPKGVQRTGYTTELIIKRSDFGMDKLKEAIGDEVRVAISFEGTKK